MRIGILTQPLTSNYGGILQNYALQQSLLRLGYSPITIDIGKYSWSEWLKDLAKYVAKFFIGKTAIMPATPIAIKNENKPLGRFVSKNIIVTEKKYCKIERRIISQYKLDAIIVGSDQVWRPKYNWKLLPDMFLRFAENDSIKKVAYAASFGNDKWEYSHEQTVICSNLAQRFDAVSVREESGVHLCEDCLGVKAVHVLDPTLLLDKSDYLKLCSIIPSKDAFVLAYILDSNEQITNEIKSFAKRHGVSYVIKSAGDKISDNDSIEGWLSLFRDAKYVITDSFHGTVFSIIFNKEFFVYSNYKRGFSRFQSLLAIFGLEDRIIMSTTIPEINNIDWNSVNQIKEEKKGFSISFLKNSLTFND